MILNDFRELRKSKFGRLKKIDKNFGFCSKIRTPHENFGSAPGIDPPLRNTSPS